MEGVPFDGKIGLWGKHVSLNKNYMKKRFNLEMRELNSNFQRREQHQRKIEFFS